MMAMSRVLGPESASNETATLQDSILRAASRRGVLLDPRLKQQYHKACELRDRLDILRIIKDVPPLFPHHSKLFPHQRVALSYMNRLDAYLLADQPGVGKTAVAIAWVSMRLAAMRAAQPNELQRVLVVTPNSAKDQWKRELRRWRTDDMRIRIVDGKIEEQLTALRRPAGWTIAHPEALVHAREGALYRPWTAIIFDEAQVIRNRKAQRSGTAFELESMFRVALTGHPFFKAPDELYSILKFLYPTEYTSFWRFFGMHVKATPKPFGGYDVEGVRDRKLLRWEIAPFSLRRTKRAVFKNLPPITRIARNVDLPPKARAEYDRLKKEFFVHLEGLQGRPKILAIPSVLARITRLRQYLVDPQLLGAKHKSVKYPVVKEIMDELDGPPVIFTMFKQAGIALQKYLGGRTAMICGGQTRKTRRAIERRFHAGQLDGVVIVTQAGGTALNYGRYGYVIFLDLPWTAADLEQAEGRVDRPIEGTGKLVPTTSWRVIVNNTYEGKQEKKLEHRHSMFSEVFTVNEIKRLFA